MKNKALYIICALLMVILGLSDALRGIFTPLFTDIFGFSMAQVGIIVSASYLGNLVCLLFGGVILDKIGRKKAMALFVLALAISELILLGGRVYFLLVLGFFLTLGISTLLNTTMNLLSDSFSATKSLMLLNALFFLQGIGTSGSQFILSRFSSSVMVWNGVLIAMAVLLIPLCIAITRIHTEGKAEVKKSEEASSENNVKKLQFFPIAMITISLGFYLIAEHGLTNYLIKYGTDYLKLRNVEIGYTFPTRWLSKIRISSARLYLNAQNVAVWDKMWLKDRDPESAGSGTLPYPLQRIFNIGLRFDI